MVRNTPIGGSRTCHIPLEASPLAPFNDVFSRAICILLARIERARSASGTLVLLMLHYVALSVCDAIMITKC